MSMLPPGSPSGRAIVVSATTTSAVVSGLPLGLGQYQVEVTNAGTGTAFIAVEPAPSTGTLTAIVPTSGRCSAPVLSGQSKCYTIGSNESIAVVSDSTATVYFQVLTGE